MPIYVLLNVPGTVKSLKKWQDRSKLCLLSLDNKLIRAASNCQGKSDRFLN